MTYLWVSRVIFWSFVFAMLIAATIYTVAVERHERRQQALAEAHRRRRMERFNNIKRINR